MKFTALLAAVAFATGGSTYASFTGFDFAPLGNRAAAAVQFAAWDIFGSAVINAVSAQAGDLSATLSQSVSSGPPYGPSASGSDLTTINNDLFYTFSKASSWTIAATSALGIDDAVLQLKFTTPAGGLSVGSFFTVALNGVTVTPSILATGVDTPSTTGAFSVLEWSWSDLGIASGAPLNLTFSSPVGTNPGQYHVAIDAISLDVTPVPEPHEYAIGMGALLMAVIFVRNRRQTRLAA